MVHSDDVSIDNVKRLLKIDVSLWPLQRLCTRGSATPGIFRWWTALSQCDLSWRKAACSSRNVFSRAVKLSRMIFVNTFPGMESSMIPLQMLQDDRSPFFGNFTRWLFFWYSLFSRSCVGVGIASQLESGCLTLYPDVVQAHPFFPMVMWSMWFEVLPSGEILENLWIFLWGKTVPTMTRALKVQNSVKSLHFRSVLQFHVCPWSVLCLCCLLLLWRLGLVWRSSIFGVFSWLFGFAHKTLLCQWYLLCLWECSTVEW